MQELNIVELIEKNPISRLSNVYNNKLLIKIKDNFTSFEQQLFVSSFYCYLNYDKNLDFVVDLDNIWKWLGFSTKQMAKLLLEKHFKIDIDYKPALGDSKASLDQENLDQASVLTNLVNHKISLNNVIKQDEKWGGQNKQTIMLTIKCFKSLCLKAQTKKAGEIHEYYMKMEEVMHQIVEEETDELRLQLEQKDNIILEKENTIINTKKEKQRAVEQATIAQFPLNTECIYFGTIDNTNEAGEKLIKFGHTNDLSTRVLDHHKKYNNFILTAAFRVQNKVEIENLIKTYPKIKRQIRNIEVNGKNKTEIIAYDSTNFTIERLSKHIKDIIHSKTYSIDNFNKLMQQNEMLENENKELKEEIEKDKTTITKLTLEMNEMREIIEKQKSTIDAVNIETQMASLTPAAATAVSIIPSPLLFYDNEMVSKFNEFIETMCIVRSDVEESSVNMEGQFRIWSKTKPKKETFHALKHYLDTRFKPARISKQDKDQVVHGYIGVKLIDIVYKKKLVANNPETFIFQVCRFSPNGKILNSTLLEEYQRWKKSVSIDMSDNDMKEIKEYLNSCEYVLKAVVWTDKGSNEGYYGISLKSDEHKHKRTSSTGKRVEKREVETDHVLGVWDTIAKAAQYEHMCASKMSLSIKNKVVFGDYYYIAIK
uniref:MSV199 domain-containing protein n=1 Tax=viral metagenome TaxID=1070528 RepID=A0A6C0HWB0_9ZZZZ